MKIDNELIDNYVRNFSPTNYADILIRTQNLVDKLSSINKLPKIEICWEEKPNLSIWASTNIKAREISVNLTIIRAIVELNLDSYSLSFISKLKIIAKSYFKGNLRHNDITDALIFTINNKPIECLLMLGNVQCLQYNLLLTILHEVQHILQHNTNKAEYKFMIEQDNFLRDGKYERTKSLLETDATVESLSALNNYLINKKFIDKKMTANLIGLNCFATPNPEKYVDDLLQEFNAEKKEYTPQQLNKIKKLFLNNYAKMNELYKMYR